MKVFGCLLLILVGLALFLLGLRTLGDDTDGLNLAAIVSATAPHGGWLNATLGTLAVTIGGVAGAAGVLFLIQPRH